MLSLRLFIIPSIIIVVLAIVILCIYYNMYTNNINRKLVDDKYRKGNKRMPAPYKIAVAVCFTAVIFILCAAVLWAIRSASQDSKDRVAKDAADLYEYKNEYIGDNSADYALTQALGIYELGAYTIELKTAKHPYTLIINFDSLAVVEEELNARMENYSAILLALISNADEIRWTVNGVDKGMVSVESFEDKYGNIKKYGETSEKLDELLLFIYGSSTKHSQNS